MDRGQLNLIRQCGSVPDDSGAQFRIDGSAFVGKCEPFLRDLVHGSVTGMMRQRSVRAVSPITPVHSINWALPGIGRSGAIKTVFDCLAGTFKNSIRLRSCHSIIRVSDIAGYDSIRSSPGSVASYCNASSHGRLARTRAVWFNLSIRWRWAFYCLPVVALSC